MSSLAIKVPGRRAVPEVDEITMDNWWLLPGESRYGCA